MTRTENYVLKCALNAIDDAKAEVNRLKQYVAHNYEDIINPVTRSLQEARDLTAMVIKDQEDKL